MNAYRLIPLALVGAALTAPATAQAAFPGATTGGAKSITFNSAVITGTVNPKGAPTNFYFQYGTTTKYGATTPLTPAGSGTGNVHVAEQLTGLAAVTKYHYRIIAVSPGGTTRGSDRTFTTAKIPLAFQITGTPNPVVFGSPFTIEGTLTGTGSANQPVKLQSMVNGNWVDAPVNVQQTSATGTYAFPFVTSTGPATFRVITTGSQVVTSVPWGESVAVQVSLHIHRTRHHGRAQLFGGVAPGQANAGVSIQRLKPRTGFVTVGGTVLNGKSQYSKVIKVHRHDVYRVFVAATGGYSPNVSNTAQIR